MCVNIIVRDMPKTTDRYRSLLSKLMSSIYFIMNSLQLDGEVNALLYCSEEGVGASCVII